MQIMLFLKRHLSYIDASSRIYHCCIHGAHKQCRHFPKMPVYGEKWGERQIGEVRDLIQSYPTHRSEVEFSDMNFYQIPDTPAALDDDRFWSIAAQLKELSSTLPAAIFTSASSNSKVAAICFCGVGERFRTISLLRRMAVPSIILQDPEAPWFSGDGLCPSLDDIVIQIQRRLPSVERWLMFGQSSGGYAALHASRLVPQAAAVAFSPQTFDDRFLRKRMSFMPGIKKMWVNGEVEDLKNLFLQTPSNPALIITSINEKENPTSHFAWLDHMHWARLIDFYCVRVFVINSENHSLLYKRGAVFSEILAEMVNAVDYSADALGWWMTQKLRKIEHFSQ